MCTRAVDQTLPVTVDQLTTTIKTLLKRVQYRPDLIAGFLGQTELIIDPEPP